MRLGTGTAIAAAGIGVLAGMRSLAAPATVSDRLVRDGIDRHSPAALRLLGSRRAARAFRALALSELVADKLPFVPDRTVPASLAFRLLSGAACGAALASWRGDSATLGALVAAAGTVAASYGFLAARRAAGPGGPRAFAAALAEDALVAGGYWAAQRTLE